MFNLCGKKIKEDGEVMLVLTTKFHSLTLILYSSRAGWRVGFWAMCTLIYKKVTFYLVFPTVDLTEGTRTYEIHSVLLPVCTVAKAAEKMCMQYNKRFYMIFESFIFIILT
jgi:hypothetical protein